MNFINIGGFYPTKKEHELAGSWIYDPWRVYAPIPVTKAEQFVIELAEEGHERARDCVKQGLLRVTQGKMGYYHSNVYLSWEGIQCDSGGTRVRIKR